MLKQEVRSKYRNNDPWSGVRSRI